MKVVLTYKDYAALPDDGRRYEVHDGELSVTAAPGTRHQWLSIKLAGVLDRHVSAGRLGHVFAAPFAAILSDISIVQPDIVFVASEHADRLSERGIEGAPTLVVEILSPSTEQIDRHTKFQLYARHGVAYYWIADLTALTIEAYALTQGGYALAARGAGEPPFSLPPFPDLRLDPATLWPPRPI